MTEPFKPLNWSGYVEAIGLIPLFLSSNDERPAREQFAERYAHGGGWHPMPKWLRMGISIRYPGDEPLMPFASAWLRDEQILVYPGAWVAIVQPSGDFEVARID